MKVVALTLALMALGSAIPAQDPSQDETARPLSEGTYFLGIESGDLIPLISLAFALVIYVFAAERRVIKLKEQVKCVTQRVDELIERRGAGAW